MTSSPSRKHTHTHDDALRPSPNHVPRRRNLSTRTHEGRLHIIRDDLATDVPDRKRAVEPCDPAAAGRNNNLNDCAAKAIGSQTPDVDTTVGGFVQRESLTRLKRPWKPLSERCALSSPTMYAKSRPVLLYLGFIIGGMNPRAFLPLAAEPCLDGCGWMDGWMLRGLSVTLPSICTFTVSGKGPSTVAGICRRTSTPAGVASSAEHVALHYCCQRRRPPWPAIICPICTSGSMRLAHSNIRQTAAAPLTRDT